MQKTIQLSIFKKTNLSDIYTLNSLSPVTLYILSVIFLNEQIKTTATLGILIMAVGIYILNYDCHNKNIFHPFVVFVKNKYSQLYLGGMVLSNISSLAEKTALNNTFPSNVFYLAFWENFFLVLLIGGYVLKTNRGWKEEIKTNFFQLLGAGMIFTLLYFLVIFGFKDGPIALVSGVKKLEVLFVIFFSFLLFKERPAKKTYVAAIIMLLSVFLIKA